MKVTVSIAGRGATFYLVQQLLKRNRLKKLITSYPKFEVAKYGIPKEKTRSILIKEVLERGWHRSPRFLRKAYDPSFLIHEVFDKLAKRHIDECDILWSWTSFSLHSLRKAKKLGALSLVELGNAHVSYQHKILAEEYARYGAPFFESHPRIITKMIQEYNEANYLPVPSSYIKRTLVENSVLESKILVLPYGADLKEFRQIPKEDNKFRIVFAGGLSIRKGVHYLLRAFSELNLPNSELVFLGSVNDEIKPFLKKYGKNTKLMGHIPQKELYKHYSQGSVFCLPSLDDGFAVVILQAMACGIPIIVSENTGGPDVITDGREGFIIPIRDIDALKEKILHMYDNQDKAREMGKLAKQRVASGFTWDDYGERVIKAFEKILAKKNG